eukprot:Nitzschia sp. Nitz4//scaffold69_size99277//78687//83589//NITZ4_004646-RA/size99277-augustus-gene-0.6-mRNA-1//1//CDS//3329556754//4397//frame0
MGASHTTLSSTSIGIEDGIPELEGNQSELSAYALDQHLFPGSGRMMRTFRLRHKSNASTVVLKSTLVAKDQESLVEQQEQELKRIRSALKGQTHVAPFFHWTLGSYRPKANIIVRQIYIMRPHMFSTLSDRLASRPFLTHVEKLWIAYQILQALHAMHEKGVVHGFLTAENVGLSSWNWVVLLDLASYKARTALPDDDPTEYLYYFQENYQSGTDTTPREKRCYLAPERFYTPSLDPSAEVSKLPLTPAMDIFSAGCVIMETFLNGERALDLGDLMEYRKKKASQTLLQKLNKIEFSALRAACRHMLHLDPTERLSASAYIERLEASGLLPESFSTLATMMERATYATPDARLAIAATYFSRVIWETLGIQDAAGSQFVHNVLGPTLAKLENLSTDSPASLPSDAEEKKEEAMSSADLFAETEALLKRLEAMNLESEADAAVALDSISTPNTTTSSGESKAERSEMAQHSLLVYLQLILSTVRNVQRPSSKLVALQLMERVGCYSDDEARLQRILPVAVSLLQDHDPLVRAKAIQVLVSTVSPIESFPPSDSKVFPEYIFKRVSHLITDPCLVVRLSFARSIAVLAETAQRFLDISHAVRLYEAVGGVSSSGSSHEGQKESKSVIKGVFTDDVAKLLDESSKSKESKADSVADSAGSDGAPTAGKTLFKGTYSSELGVLQETVSRWVVHITTDQSEKSSPVKQALLEDMARLCTFFGLDGVLAFILPQVLSFLNERKDWQLRASLFDCLPSVCHIVGRAATEHFVIPCLETALADEEEAVISRALRCLTKLLSMNLLSRALMLGTPSSYTEGDSSQGLLAKYAVLLVHPSSDVRFFAIETVILLSRSLGHPDAVVFVSPLLRPFLRFQPSLDNLTSRQSFELCIQRPWERARFQSELEKMSASSDYAMSPTSGNWTSIAFEPQNKPDKAGSDRSTVAPLDQVPKSRNDLDVQVTLMRDYLKLLARRKAFLPKGDIEKSSLRSRLNQCIDAPIKQSQQIKFPKQSIPGLPASTLPSWYKVVRSAREEQKCSGAETVAIRTVASLGQVYGLSIMDQNGGNAPSHADVSSEEAVKLLLSDESQQIKAASAGEWGSETFLNPTLIDTSLLVTKLNALQVPPLPPKLSDESISMSRNTNQNSRGAHTKEQSASSAESKLKIDTMVATSKCSPEHGHSAPIVRLVVSHDQRFFVTGSHDGTCRVWELDKAEKSNGILESSVVYNGHAHTSGGYPKVKDVAVVEGGHSVVSGTSDGSVHVWRVDMVSSSTKSTATQADNRDVSRVVGSSEIRRLEPDEGEILAINHFNTNSSSILTYASQRGYIHSWDLRAAQEPFQLRNPQDTGYITSMAVGSDRNWVVTGTSKGFISLWDLRFQQILKLWHHSRSAPVNRLATSFVPPPQSWNSTRGNVDSLARPFLFAASGPNECAMFDLWSGTCRECFRTIDYGGRYAGKVNIEGLPTLEEMPLSGPSRRKAILSKDIGPNLGHAVASSFRSVNALVGSIGASDHSFLITGGSDCRIRFWDFALPSKCYVSMGPESMQPRPTFERIDNDQTARLMLCRQPPVPSNKDLSSSKLPRKLLQGTKRAENVHEDAITDLKVVKAGVLSSSRDCTVKLWR